LSQGQATGRVSAVGMSVAGFINLLRARLGAGNQVHKLKICTGVKSLTRYILFANFYIYSIFILFFHHGIDIMLIIKSVWSL
jgi:hypothetical protein